MGWRYGFDGRCFSAAGAAAGEEAEVEVEVKVVGVRKDVR